MEPEIEHRDFPSYLPDALQQWTQAERRDVLVTSASNVCAYDEEETMTFLE